MTIDQDKNIICGDGATASNDPDSDWPGSGIIVIGNGTVAKGYESTVIGDGANATGDYTTALGARASAAQGSVAIGANADASLGEKSVAIGNSSIGTGQWSVAIGSVSEASGDSALALGYHSVASASKSVALGCDTEAREENSTAIGYYSKAKGKNSMAIGYTSVAQEENTTAIGFKSEAHGKASTVIGSGAIVYGENSVAIGFGSYTDRENSVSVGHGAIEYDGPQYRQIINVADGTENNDAATYGQIIKKDTYTIQINDDGNGETTLATNAGNDGPTITIDASGLSNKITENTNKITAVDNKIGSLSADGTYIKKVNNVSTNLGALDTQVKANADAIGSLSADGTYIKKANNVSANLGALDTQVKTNTDAIGSLSADGKYIKKANNVSANLVELDNQVNANATAITNKANLDLSNISTAGKDVIINLAGNKAGEIVDVKLGNITSENYVKKADTVNANISALDTQLNKVDNKIGTMTDGNYVSAGNTVAGNLSALDNQLKANAEAINTKADKDLSNITDAGKNVIKDLAGNKAGEVVDAKLGDITSENYVKKADTVNANISALDKQVKTNADAINTKADKDLSNITDAGKNVIKDLAGNKAGEVVDAKLGDITSENYVKKADTVNANISALDKQMKANTDNIGDTSKLTAAGLGSNLSDAVVNVNNKVGTADELKALKDAGLGDNLAQATAAVNKKADKNAADIKTVNGRVDELGGRVDTLGGAVSKLDTKVNKVGAGAAALTALHPMDFDPDNKLSFAVGVGSYHGASAVAIGAFYRPSEQVMFSISGNMGNGENMVNAGVSFALDRPSKTPTTKAALVKTVAAQNEQIAALKETVAEQKEIVAEQNEKIARLEAMVEKLAAKQST